jgi:hypothetical protein
LTKRLKTPETPKVLHSDTRQIRGRLQGYRFVFIQKNLARDESHQVPGESPLFLQRIRWGPAGEQFGIAGSNEAVLTNYFACMMEPHF